ncbi:DUF547 domain-containing protein [Halobaculum sp. EA56]|uniref:DUF547 domain-containing protein n=1 Tax=Halobaculum sp. EA56 TaxID=3421648 RepID=UPI003EB6DB7D
MSDSPRDGSRAEDGVAPGSAGGGSGAEANAAGVAAAPADPLACARRLLDSTRSGEGVDDALAALSSLRESALAPVREDRAAALAFWCNLYNAGTQVLLDRHPERYESPLRLVRFFGTDCVAVAGTPLSLDDIEHGILRGSRSKYGLGYLPRLPVVSVGAFERRYRLSEPDPRVHFALNCGAASCPAIRYYERDRIDEQLDLATEAYLDATVEYDPGAGVVRVPRVIRWYAGDFDDPVAFLKRYGTVPADADPRVRYRSWDWSRAPGKFADGAE